MKVAERSCLRGKPIHNMYFPVTPKMVRDAIVVADALGSVFRLRHGGRSSRTSVNQSRQTKDQASIDELSKTRRRR